MQREGWLRAACFGLLALSAIGACAGRATDLTAVGSDSESHFLVQCEPGGCGAGLSCLSGVCSAACSRDSDCRSLATGAVCRGPEQPHVSNELPSRCDVECSEPADCSALGPLFSCNDGLCRSPGSALSSSFARACSTDVECAAGLSCIDNACSQLCEFDRDCSFPGASCPRFERQDGSIVGGKCVYACDESALAPHSQCAFLGEGGRCTGTCVETLPGQCADVGLPGSQWSCYEDIAADVFRSRHELLLDDELCLETTESRIGDIAYRRCPDSTCSGGGSGCAVRGLVLESAPLPMSAPNNPDTTVLAARGELRLPEPVQVQLDLLEPAERCEYAVTARFWNIDFFESYTYLAAGNAGGLPGAGRLGFSPRAREGGFWQVTHSALLAHDDNGSDGVIIEDSESEVQLLSGGERCRLIQEHVGVVTRDSLTEVLNPALRLWGAGIEDTVECTQCGRLDCELACRFRSPG